eukprot:403361839
MTKHLSGIYQSNFRSTIILPSVKQLIYITLSLAILSNLQVKCQNTILDTLKSPQLNQKFDQSEYEHQSRKLFEGVRGFLEGYNQGFYSNPSYKINDDCLSEETITSMNRVFYFIQNLSSHNLIQLGVALQKVSNLYFENCEIQQYLYTPTAFCLSHDCDTMILISNALNSQMALFAEGAKINTRIFEGKPDSDTLFDHWKQIGKSVAIMYQKVLGFKPRRIF